jgi:hypothetical protein
MSVARGISRARKFQRAAPFPRTQPIPTAWKKDYPFASNAAKAGKRLSALSHKNTSVKMSVAAGKKEKENSKCSVPQKGDTTSMR